MANFFTQIQKNRQFLDKYGSSTNNVFADGIAVEFVGNFPFPPCLETPLLRHPERIASPPLFGKESCDWPSWKCWVGK